MLATCLNGSLTLTLSRRREREQSGAVYETGRKVLLLHSVREGAVRSGLTGLPQCLTTCLNGSLSRWERAGVRASARNTLKSGPSGRFSIHPLQMRQAASQYILFKSVRPLLSTSSSNASAARGAPVANQAQIIAFHGLNQRLIIQLTVQPLA